MGLMQIAGKFGAPAAALEQLLAGDAPASVGEALRTTASSVRRFIDGDATGDLARAFGVTAPSLQELRDRLGREGAIGFLVGVGVGRALAPREDD